MVYPRKFFVSVEKHIAVWKEEEKVRMQCIVCCSGHSLSLPPCASQTRLKAWIDGVTATVLELPKPN